MSNYTYMVTNKINGKVYVGSHTWDGTGLDPNYYGSGTAITRAVKKYGKENFQVEVLYYYKTVEECRKDEERILTEYNVKDCPYSYNCKNSAIGFTSEDNRILWQNEEYRQKANKKKPKVMRERWKNEEYRNNQIKRLKEMWQSEEFRKKMSQKSKERWKNEEFKQKMGRIQSQAQKGKKRTDTTRQKISQAQNYRKIPIVAIDKNGKVKIFESQAECARKLNLDSSNIYSCLKGRQKTCKGYIIKYLEQLESGIYEGITELALEHSKTAPTPVIAIQKDTGKIRIFESQNECARQLNLNQSHIHHCLTGRGKTCGGYIIKYLKRCGMNYKITKRKAKKTEKIKLTTKRKGTTPIVAIHKATGRVRMFLSQRECSRVLGIHKGNVNSCLKGSYKSTGGYIIKYLKRCSKDYKITKRKAKKTEKIKLTTKIKGTTPIVAIQKDTGRVRMFESQNECARQLNLDQSSISSCLKGRRNHTGGYTFKYINRDRRVFTVSQRSKADINRLRGIA